MESVDVLDSKSSALGRAGSSPATGTNSLKARKPLVVLGLRVFFFPFPKNSLVKKQEIISKWTSISRANMEVHAVMQWGIFR